MFYCVGGGGLQYLIDQLQLVIIDLLGVFYWHVVDFWNRLWLGEFLCCNCCCTVVQSAVIVDDVHGWYKSSTFADW